ncbi:flagellar biosynthesis protein FlhB [Undibacterium sp. SXout11W]|uniref:flagellar biosynthesis protein FlhB n=1 Tax=Undibacterium sp. SXout11W TaxID=3413050 RepID=UPI003BF07EF9
MAEESDLEKTEPASSKRLEQAREEGDVPRSRELSTCAILFAAGGAFWAMGGGLVGQLQQSLISGLTLERAVAFDFNLLISKAAASLLSVLIAFAPMAGVFIVVALSSPVLIGGWLFSTKAIQPNFGRMNPISGLGNMFSVRALVELIKAIVKTILVGSVAWVVILRQKEAIFALPMEDVASSIPHVGHMLLVCFISIVGALVVIAAIDAPYQMWQYANKLKMTRQEVIQESKEANGNPQIKAKIRQQQREMARRRMMAEIPKADVVVTNPTHFAVALKYTEGGNGAPKVVAKGADEVAAKIRELAKEHNIPMLEAPPLARALFKHTDLGDEIPEALYSAVAEVLAYVYQLRTYRRDGGSRPEEPRELKVPEELDPNNKLGVVE